MTPWSRRCALWGALGALAGAAGPAPALAQGPEPTPAELVHRAWTSRDGAPAMVRALAQSADGVLWVGTHTGLYRFDGTRFEEFAPPAGRALLSRRISTLLALPDGALWVGYALSGATVLTGGRVVHYGEREGLPPATILDFARDSAGVVWAATTAGLSRLDGGRWRSVGAERGFPGGVTNALLVDRRGTLWAANRAGVYVLPRGAARFERRAPSLDGPPIPSGGVGAIREAPDGSVWGASWSLGLTQLADVRGGQPLDDPYRGRDTSSIGLLVDRRANAWLWGGYYPGVVRVALTPAPRGAAPAAGRTRERLPGTRATGWSGSQLLAMLEDREGSIWVATDGGLDQFRASKLTPVAWPRPVIAPAIAAGDDGALWVGDEAGALAVTGPRAVARSEVPALTTCAYRDLDGDVWLGGTSGLLRWDGATFVPIRLPQAVAGGAVQAIARGRDGVLWVSRRGGPGGSGVFRRRGGARDGARRSAWERFVPPPGIERAHAFVAVADSAGYTWLGYPRGRLVRATGDAARVFAADDGLRVGDVTAVHVRGERVWVGGDDGVAFLPRPARAGGAPSERFRPLAAADTPLRGITGIVETAAGELWLNGADGVVRVPAAEVRRAMQEPAYRVRTERFDHHDGVDGAAPQVGRFPSAVAGTDGRLWFSTQSGNVAWVDPRRLRRNPLPPPVQVRWLRAGGREHEAAAGPLALPARTTALSVGYTALSLAVPERVRFRYRLVGLDTAWQDAGARREAYYTNLGPGAYRFEVRAANEDGVWNTAGAALDVVIPPTFAQTNVFLALCAGAAGGAVWSLAVWRQRRVAAAGRARFEAALAERVRVARELHDTLLSDLAGITMQLDAAAGAPGAAAGVGTAVVAAVRDQARQALDEARRTVVGLRAEPDDAAPLPAQLREAAQRVFAGTNVNARVEQSGAAHPLSPAAEAEVLRVASEAMTNAREHARCRSVTVTCAYGRRALTVAVRDDGRGFDPAVATAARRDGHYGLAGMRERAAALGARLAIDSAPGRGTEVRLVVPLRRATVAAALRALLRPLRRP